MVRRAMLTTLPSRIAIPEPRVTVASVSRPSRELSARSSATGAAYLLAEHVGRVRDGSPRGEPAEDGLTLGVAHQPDDVAGSRLVDEGFEHRQLGRVRRHVGDTDTGR